MSNIEILMHPIYISADNMVTPLTTISFEKLYTSALVFANFVVNNIQIGIQTAIFIMKEGFAELFSTLTVEKIAESLFIYNVLILTAYICSIGYAINNQRRKLVEQKKQIESLEKNILYLKETERMREDLEESWIQETTKKIRFMENKIKKMDKEIKQYE